MSRRLEPLAIRPHRPWLRWAGAAGLGALAVAVAWAAFDYGRVRGGYDRRAAEAERLALEAEIERLRGERDTLRARLARIERERVVERAAHERLQALVDGLQAENGRLRETLAFYERVVGPRDGRRGLRVQSFALEAGAGPREWRYKLVLAQSPRRRRLARGVVDLELEGEREGAPVRLGLARLTAEGEGRVPFRFRYFQYLEGTLRLPEGFVPRRLVLRVSPRGAKEAVLERTWSWSELTEETADVAGRQAPAHGADRDPDRAQHRDPR